MFLLCDIQSAKQRMLLKLQYITIKGV